MRHPFPPAKAANSLQLAVALGVGGDRVRRVAAGIFGGPSIVLWLVFMTAVVSCGELAAQTATSANPLRPPDAWRVEDAFAPAGTLDVAGAMRPDSRQVRFPLCAVAIAAEQDRPVVVPAAPIQAEDGLRSLAHVSVDIRPPAGDLPGDPAASKFAAAGLLHHVPGTNRPWPLHAFRWEAPSVCHQPLYFEQVNLERYGYTWGVAQPFLSAAHFFGTIPVLPYMMGADPYRCCTYTLGHYRPGSCAPFHLYHLPLSLRGAAVEAAAMGGLFFAAP